MIRNYHWRHDCGAQYSYGVHPAHTQHFAPSAHINSTQSYEAAPPVVPAIHLNVSPLLAFPLHRLLFGVLSGLVAWAVTR
jgi:hypothetical protein